MTLPPLFASLPLFAGLTPYEQQNLASSLTVRQYRSGETIFHEGDPGQVMYIIEKGQVRISVVNEAGQEMSVTLYGAGDVFGELAVIDGLPRSASAIALGKTVVHTLDSDAFRLFTRQMPQFALNFMKTLSVRVRYNTRQMGSLTSLDVSGRLARKLIELARDHGIVGENGVQIDAALTQSDLASLVGSSRERVNKVLRLFREDGLITLADGRITIHDVDALRARARPPG